MRFGKSIGSAGWRVAGQISAPSVWGKLPTHADYLQHGVKVGETEAWQAWLATQVRPVTVPKTSSRKPKRPGERWLELDAGQRRPSSQQLPVAFVLPAGTLAFAEHQHVLGVVADSRDRLGRPHPIIVYQCASTRWLQLHMASEAEQDPTQARERWLFALARLVNRYLQDPDLVAAWEESHDDDRANAGDRPVAAAKAVMSLPEAVGHLWTLYAPGWQQWMGMAKRSISAQAVQAMLDRAPVHRDADAAEGLRGMTHLPWADWPHRLWATHPPRAAFWQQDSNGGYVGASLRLGELWGR